MELRLVCGSPWCKATFIYQSVEGKNDPEFCPKCKSFDGELSGGVTWVDKKYEGSRMDGLPHQTSLNVSKYTDKKKW